MGFQSNQSRHLYVANTLKTTSGDPSVEGNIKFFYDDANKEFFFKHYGKGGLIRTDIVPVKNITNITATSHANLRRALLGKKVTLSNAMLSGINLANTGDYILNLTVFGAYGTGTENKLLASGAVNAAAGSTASDFYKKMACSLYGNLSKADGIALNVFVTTLTGPVDLVAITSSDVDDYTSTTAVGIVVRQAIPDWKPDTLPMVFADFSLSCNGIETTSGEELWMAEVTASNGDVTDSSNPTWNWVGNGRVTAELERFTMKQRGDVYGNVGYPYVVNTEYFVDPTKEYDYLNIHYHLTEGGTNNDWSEKDMQIVCESTDNVVNDIIDALEESCSVDVGGNYSSIRLDKSMLNLTANGTAGVLEAIISGDSDARVSWESSDNDKVTVEGSGEQEAIGTVTPNESGTATITATYMGKKATCEVTVAS